jgi:hypothetical protein
LAGIYYPLGSLGTWADKSLDDDYKVWSLISLLGSESEVTALELNVKVRIFQDGKYDDHC